MTALDRDSEIIRLASDLKLESRGRPTAAILKYCQSQISNWVRTSSRVGTLGDLEDLVCRELGLVFEEFRDEEELDRIIKKYIGMGEYVFAAQRDEFDSGTYATLIRRDNATPSCLDRFVALIDCRGSKNSRRFFTRWHEIAHVLTLVDRQMALPFHRSKACRDPIERLMDKIAADIGFYDPIFRPAVENAVSSAGTLSLEVVEEIRRSNCPAASFQATLIATVKRAPVPAVSLEAGLGLKKSEEESARNGFLFPQLAPKHKLRVLKVGGNDAAKKVNLRIHRNMQVPSTSVVASLHSSRFESVDAKGVESLTDWTTSDGQVIGDHDVVVDARRYGDRVVALVVLAS